ncbi:hypothetical protein Moror_14432 [Moniliophthora roreri MCA 2997]|uniref:Uncharacterized protein n=1 Tax=Moniliophthora roreri (strain MCA 2997) TaxID=1381753 RepID=V2W361_MONRO|nr:hypothetical protein Moror_14432 [Moniliophthora roreri MCA 2997]
MSNSSVTEEDITPFNIVTTILVQPMVNLTVMFYVYGIYTILFIISLHILIHRQDCPNRVLYMFFTIALFTLTSANNIVLTFDYARQAILEFTFTKNQDWESFLAYLQLDAVGPIIVALEMVLPLCLVTMADIMLLHRCYVMWNSSKCVAFPMIFLMVTLAVISISNTADLAEVQLFGQSKTIDTAFWLADMGVNITLTLLTAGRLWWHSREPQKHLGPAVTAKYKTIIVIILESRLLYPTFLIAAIVLQELVDPDNKGLALFSLWIVTYQVAGIAPTLSIIWAVGGKTVEYTSTDQVVSSLHFANGGGSESRNSDIRSHAQTANIEACSSAERVKDPGEVEVA